MNQHVSVASIERASERELALTAHTRRQAFHRKIAETAAVLAAINEPTPRAVSLSVSIVPEAMPAEPDPPKKPAFKECWFQIVDVSACKKLSMLQIKLAVCDHFGVTHGDMISARRQKDIIPPRQVAMYLCKALTPSTFPAIGRAFGGRDHTTALHGFRKIERLILTDADLAATVAKIRAELEAML